MNKKLLTGLSIFALFSSAAFAATYTLESPSKNLKIVLDDAGDNLTYKVLSGDASLVNSSELSILPNKKAKVISTKESKVDKTWKPVFGQSSEIRDNHNEIILSLDLEGRPANLIVRAFDDGLGFRYELDNYNSKEAAKFYLEYNLDKKDIYSYYSTEHSIGAEKTLAEIIAKLPKEAEPEPLADTTKKSSKKKSKKGDAKTEKKAAKAKPIAGNPNFPVRMPVIIEKENGKHLALIESDLIESSSFGIISFEYVPAKNLIAANNALAESESGKIKTPWRIILVEDNLGDLVVNNVALNLATECQIKDTSWIKAGKSLWDWRILGAKYDGFTYNIDTASYKRLIDFASANGIEFFLMDDGWFTKATEATMIVNKNLDYDAILAYSKEKGVDLALYYDRHKGDFGDEHVFAHYNKIEGKAMKYGFMGANVDFTKNAIKKSAEYKLLVDFHDTPVPMVGTSRTYPNAIAREFCHAQQDSRKVFTPTHFILQAQINALQGPLDMNNGNFAINDINALKRTKGPKIKDSYKTTVANEAARCMIIHTGFLCLSDAPEAYAAKADLFEYIKVLPTGKWDESMILHSKMGKYITTARRHGDAWFVSSSANEEGATLPIKLDFLKEGKTYDATLYEDAPETDCFTNPEAYQIRKIKVKKGDIIEAKLAKGGGHNMWIR